MIKSSQGQVVKVSGPLVIAKGMRDADMFDVVEVSENHLIGEIIEMHGDEASIQVYEETAGLGPGEIVVSRGTPLSVELGPGLIGEIFDGIQRPLETLVAAEGDRITRGAYSPALNRESGDFRRDARSGTAFRRGHHRCRSETEILEHCVMIPLGAGTLCEIQSGRYRVSDDRGTETTAGAGHY